MVAAVDLFDNKEKIDISLLFAGDCGVGANSAINPVTVSNEYLTVAASRKDCVAFVSPAYANVVGSQASASAVVSHRNALTDTSYGVMDSGWKYQYDKYNDVYRWVPLNADIAGLCVRTDLQRDPWFSPAGLNRGQVRNLVKLAFNPTQSERDTLYKAGVNPVVSFPGEGTVLFGDKTLQGRPSAFDRINVRRLFIVLEKAISTAARSSLFEFNDEFTRSQFVALVEPFLRDVQGRRGIFDFRVVCDETNNTAGVIDRNEFVGDIYIKPARSVNFIQLNFVAVRSGVAFDEIVGRF
jgi:phage tail sheath protein FI